MQQRVLITLVLMVLAINAKLFGDIGQGYSPVKPLSTLGQFTELTLLSVGVDIGSVAWGDYDNDGDLDVLLTGYNYNTLTGTSRVYRNNGNGTFSQIALSLPGVENSSVAWGDYDNDGFLDILLTGLNGNTAISKVFKNNGNGSFSEQTAISLPGVWNSSVAWGDYDNDGKLDILLVGNTNGSYSCKIFKNNGNGTFTQKIYIPLSGSGQVSAAWGDYNNDSYLDVLLTGGGISRIHKNNGNGTFTEQSTISLVGVSSSSAAWGDYNNDGFLDMIITGSTGYPNTTSKIYKNNGNGTFSLQTGIQLTGVTQGSVAWGDYDNDGNLDLLLTGYDGVNRISKLYKNDGNGTFADQTSILLKGVYNSSVAWGDYDNDGDLDFLLTGGSTSGRVSLVYKNNNATANTKPSSPINLSSVIDSNGILLNWDKSTDTETPQNGLHYNIVIGTSVSSVNTLSPMADRISGYRRVVRLGNSQANRWTIKDLPQGKYYWSVQAIDGTFTGSEFAQVDSFDTTIPIPDAPILVTPENNSRGLTNPLIASWFKSNNATNYWLQLSADSLFANLLFNDSALVDTTKLLPTLLNYTKYYWRIKAINAGGESEWSEVWNFKTLGNPYACNLILPLNNSVNQTTSCLVFMWTKPGERIEGIQKYQYQLSTDSLFGSLVVNDSTITDTAKTVNNLSFETKYYWRVRAGNEAGWGDWSEFFTFTTKGPGSLLLISPNGGEKWIVGSTRNIIWTSSDVSNVKIEYTTNNGISWINIIEGIVSNTGNYSWTIPEISSANCRIRVSDGCNLMVNDISDSVFIILPINAIVYGGKIYNPVLIGTQTWLKENLDIGVMIQGLQTATNNGIIEKYCYDNNPVNCEMYGGLYSWNEAMQYVTTSGAQGICPDGWHIPTISEFITLKSAVGNDGNALKAVGQGSGGGTGTNTTGFSALLTGWKFDNGSFAFLYGITALWSSTESNPTVTAHNLMMEASNNSINIGCTNCAIESGFSLRCTKDIPTPAVPNLISPVDNSIQISTLTKLEWSYTQWADQYQVQISSNINFGDIIIDTVLLTNIGNQTYQCWNLSAQTQYFWRVRAINQTVYGSWSETWSFKTLGNPYASNLIQPVNNSVNHPPNNAVFKWTKARERIETIQNYQYQLATDSFFASVVVNDTTLTDTTKTVSGLSYLTKYYWRVRAQNQTGWGDWSEVWNTTTIIEKPANFTLSTPANFSKGLPNPLTVNWSASARAEKYILQVSTDSTFATFVVNDSAQTDLTEVLPTLSNYSQYYWRVKAVNIGGQSDWSEVWNFKTLGNPYASTLYTPANNSVNQAITGLVFKWSKAQERIETIQKYQYQLATDSLFSGIVLNDTLLTDTTKTISGLSYLTKYYWRVRASNQTGWGDWSEVWKLTTIIEKPANFVLSSPANNSKGMLNPVTVNWSASARAEKYILQVATDSLFASFVVNDSAQTDLTDILPTLSNYTQYYWRAKAVNTGGQSEWTPVWSFKTLGNPYASVLYSPANNSVNQPVAGLTFNWSKAIERIETIQKYQLQISTDSLFSTFVLNDSTLTDTTKVMNGLSYLTRYHWRVRAQNQTGWGEWSDRWVTTTIIEKPAITSLASPANNATQLLQPVTLKWLKPLRADIYRLEVSETSNFASLIWVDSTLTDTVKVLPQLEAPRTYYWRVRSSNTGGVSDYSAVWNFRTLGKPLTVTLAAPANNSTHLPVTGVKLTWLKPGEQTMAPIGGGNSRNFRNDYGTTSSQLRASSKAAGLVSDGRITSGEGIEGGESILGYWLQMTTDTSGALYTISDSTLTDTFKVLPALNYLSSYFWRVKALNENGWGAFSGWYRFTTIIERPSQPLLASPANNALGLVQPVTLKWHSAHRAEKYALEVSTAENFSSVVHRDTSLTDTSKLLPVLGVYTKYYWRVTAKNAGGTSDTSAIFSFKTLGTPAGVALVTPSQNAQNIPVANILFNWTKAYDRIETILGYRFELKTDTAQSGYIVLDSLLTDTTKTVAQLQNQTVYYWRVGARNEAGWSQPTAWSKFTTIIAAPGQVTLQQPANNAMSTPVRPLFKWNRIASAERYLIEVSANQGFTSIILRDSLVTDTVKTFADSLLFNTKYYWRVKASNIGGSGNYSAVWNFTTAKRSINVPVNLTAAATGVKKVTLSWIDKSDNESGFIIFRKQGDSASTNTLTAIDTSSANSVQYIDTTVATDQVLFSYRIIAYNQDTTSPPSNYAVVLTLTDVTDYANGSVPEVYTIEQNYPNPFNPSTTIRYGLPYDSDVRLEIYDISGQKLQTLVSETQSAGYYEAVFDISGMSSGTYLYILTATRLDGDGEFHQVKKMILLK